MDSNSLLTKLEESQALLHEVLYDANVVSDVLEQAELRVSDANAKYTALRRFVCSALMAELKRQADEQKVEGMLHDLILTEKPIGAWDPFDALMAHYAQINATPSEERDGNDQSQQVNESADVDMANIQYPDGPMSSMSLVSTPEFVEGPSDAGEGPSSSRRRAKGKEPVRRSPRLKRASDYRQRSDDSQEAQVSLL
ncbi:uncharacterized protein STEHIDRAFT_159238 [Stereum hirsutum FP-91666 SS1]|uniref:uncharacterized protein n=1 Tax=Stereum hirsutum (strain FP-91666) TaxID=721885 RepID=UPI000444A65B|nr:uncharacterized protein STEHIDRAFT_159238 [Stereum hirsutum FP-91666 SS1]EIM84573.1 hypothetical protein STEHIDRAFT_159238 [Stereum hirsutum FP-91666 SS1]